MNDQKTLTARPILRAPYRDSIPQERLTHLEAMGAAIPQHILSDNAYLALLLIATARRVTVDAYQRTDGRWNIECHGTPGQEVRYSPAGWQIMHDRYLSEAVISGFMPLCDLWLTVCERIGEDHPYGNHLLPDGLQWADATPEGVAHA